MRECLACRTHHALLVFELLRDLLINDVAATRVRICLVKLVREEDYTKRS